MIEVSTSQSRRAVPPPVRRRASRPTGQQRNTAALSFYLNLQAQSQSPLSTGSPVSYFDGQNDPQQQSPVQTSDLGLYSNFFSLTDSPSGQSAVQSSFHQNGHFDNQWPSSWLPTAHSAGLDQVASQYVDVNAASSTQSPMPSQMSSPELSMSWDDAPPTDGNHRNSDVDNASILEAQLGIASYGSCEYVTSPNPLGSSFSDYVIPSANTSLYGSPRSKHHLIQDLQLPADYFHGGHNPNTISSPASASASSPLYPDMFNFESENLSAVSGWMNDEANSLWSAGNLPTQHTPQTLDQEFSDPNFLFPWNTLDVQNTHPPTNQSTEAVVFDGDQATQYYTFPAQEEYLRNNPTIPGPPRHHNTVPVWEGDTNEKNKEKRKDSQDLVPSRSRSGSPWQHIADHHSHIFSVRSGIEKAKPQRGRMRPLTIKGKREALEVRNAGACWACHLSKVKCSPCSSGSPCEQCSRLLGKRRFCHLPCFNDPIESLNIFLIPDYLMGHFTQAHVESFVNENASSWGTHILSVRMEWGCPKPLVVDVVTLVLRNENSELGFQRQGIATGGTPALVKMNSPPLGIPLNAMADMEDVYSQYVRDLVRNDLDDYVWTAYDDQSSQLSERLLAAISTFYKAGLDVGEESEMIRSALEVHVTCTILERSLILDQESINMVSYCLGQEYPTRSAARCAQRQMKLAFFMAQRKRILDVLQKWGNLMWATTGTSTASANNGHKWTTSFSVFLILILVMDKTLIAAWYFCEGKIKHDGEDAARERTELRNLLRLTQTQLFERCKEVFHSRFKTRKAGKESCNPIRDGWRGRAMEMREEQLVKDLQAVTVDFGWEIRAHRSSHVVDPPVSDLTDEEVSYDDAGRLASIFLGDFLNF